MSSALLDAARDASARSRVPFSSRPRAVALRHAGGAVTVGVRVESASYPLTIPALQAAWAIARANGRGAPTEAAATGAWTPGELAWLDEWSGARWTAEGGLARPDPAPSDVPPAHDRLAELRPRPSTDADGVALALEAAGCAAADVSGFPVGCALDTDIGVVLGANVEHAADWTRGLCAERVALASAVAQGAREIRRIWLACPQAPAATPCGGCRQQLWEAAPDAAVRMWNGDHPPAETTTAALLPGGFDGRELGAG